MTSGSSVTEMTSGEVIAGGSSVTEMVSGDILPSTERTETIMRTTKPAKGSMQESKSVTTTKITSGGSLEKTISGSSVRSA